MPAKSLRSKLQNSLNTSKKHIKKVKYQRLGEPTNIWINISLRAPSYLSMNKNTWTEKVNTVQCKTPTQKLSHLNENSPHKTGKIHSVLTNITKT